MSRLIFEARVRGQNKMKTNPFKKNKKRTPCPQNAFIYKKVIKPKLLGVILITQYVKSKQNKQASFDLIP